MTTRTRSLESLEESDRKERSAVPRFENIRDRAKKCYSALNSSWNCVRHANHTVSLLLEPRFNEATSDNEEAQETGSNRPFHVLLGYDDLNYAQVAHPAFYRLPIWEEMDVHLALPNSLVPLAEPSESAGE